MLSDNNLSPPQDSALTNLVATSTLLKPDNSSIVSQHRFSWQHSKEQYWFFTSLILDSKQETLQASPATTFLKA